MAAGRVSRLTLALGLALARRALRRSLGGPGAEAAMAAVLTGRGTSERFRRPAG
jgi:hypothetical protein